MHEGSGDDGDVWADSSDDGRPDRRELDREAAARHQKLYNAGYREAIGEGKERTLQEGFNTGFREGAAAGFEWGLLRGAVKTLAALDGQAAGTRGLHSQIQALQLAADLHPRDAMLGILRQLLLTPSTHPHPASPPPAHTQSHALASGPLPSPTRSSPGATRADAAAPIDLVQSFKQLTATVVMTEASAPGGGETPRGWDAGPSRQGDGEANAAASPSHGSQRLELGTEPQAGEVAVALPEDTADLRLPDMRRVQWDLRVGLQRMGFCAGEAPVPPSPAGAVLGAAPGGGPAS